MLIGYLQVYCDIIDTRSFSKAAARNAISQPAVSQQVKTLEEHFDQQLIERSAHGIHPTEAGQLFYQGAREILERYRTLELQLTDLNETVAGTIRVATVYSVGLHDLPPYIKEFLKAYPQARIHVEYGRTNKIIEALRLNQVDVGIVAYPQESRQLGLIPLSSDEMMVVVDPEHPLASHTGPVKLSALQGLPFVAFEADIPTRIALDRILHASGVTMNIVQEFDNVETVKRSVEAEIGISIVPSRTVRSEVKAGSLIALSIADSLIERPVGVLYRRGRSFSRTLQKFLDVLTSSKHL